MELPELPAEIPTAEPEPRRLDPRVIQLWRVGQLIRTAVAAGLALALESQLVWALPVGTLAGVVATLGAVLAIFWPPAQYRAWSFQIREDDLFVRHGVLWRTTSIFPHARIQHVDTRHGPVERWLGLARLVIYTAGVRGADLVIPGLSLAEAEALRDRLAALGGGEDAV